MHCTWCESKETGGGKPPVVTLLFFSRHCCRPTLLSLIVTSLQLSLTLFQDYKKNENKEVRVDEFLGAEAARKIIQDALVRVRFIMCMQTVGP